MEREEKTKREYKHLELINCQKHHNITVKCQKNNK